MHQIMFAENGELSCLNWHFRGKRMRRLKKHLSHDRKSGSDRRMVEKKFDTLDNAFFGAPQIGLTILQMTVEIGDFCQSKPKQTI